MTKIKEVLLKTVSDIDEAFEDKLPTPKEVAAKFEEKAKAAEVEAELAAEKAAKISPTVQMAIDQALARKAKDEYHGFK